MLVSLRALKAAFLQFCPGLWLVLAKPKFTEPAGFTLNPKP